MPEKTVAEKARVKPGTAIALMAVVEEVVASLWVFFRKGSKAAGLDVNRDDGWAVAESHGMRPLGLLSVDEAWSVFRLRAGD